MTIARLIPPPDFKLNRKSIVSEPDDRALALVYVMEGEGGGIRAVERYENECVRVFHIGCCSVITSILLVFRARRMLRYNDAVASIRVTNLII